MPVPPIEERFPRPSVMGIVNVTPDSFSDGGVNFRAEDAVASARRMVDDGAAIVDVGGESTRPGAEPVSAEEELGRIEPVLEQLAGLPVSIDTAKAEVAGRALALGAEMVNDVTALRGDPGLAEVVADSGAYLCLMHMQGEPRTMQAEPRYDDVVSEVKGFLEERVRFAVGAGIAEERICIDPGIGFGKSVEHNFELIRRLGEIAALGRPVVVGFSRKSSLGRILGDPEATTGPLSASIAAAVTAYERGATILRVHDVKEHVEALAAARAVLGVIVELVGLEVFGRHGVDDDERETGRTFYYDIALTVDEPPEDRLEATVDYRAVAACVREVSDGGEYRLIEKLAAAVADELAARFPAKRVQVRVRKPGIAPSGLAVEYSAATAVRES